MYAFIAVKAEIFMVGFIIMSFPGLLHLQFLIACTASDQKLEV